MKTITLPNGKVAHFPDTIHPDKMQAAIERHGREKPAIIVQHDHENGDERNARELRQEGNHQARHQATLSAMGEYNQKTNSAIGEHTKATVAVAQGVNKGLDALLKAVERNAIVVQQLGLKIEALSKSKEIEKLSESVDMLREQIGKSSEAVMKVMKSPRKIVHSPKGRPIGMQIED